MFKSNRPWLLVLILSTFSSLLLLGATINIDPPFLHRRDLESLLAVDEPPNFWIYSSMPLRMGPYLFGMYAAQCYHQDKSFDSILLELLSVVFGASATVLG